MGIPPEWRFNKRMDCRWLAMVRRIMKKEKLCLPILRDRAVTEG
jgi:hypothetical protein